MSTLLDRLASRTTEAEVYEARSDTIEVITKVRELRSNSVQAYFSMQTGPSVFINTTEEDEPKVKRAMAKIGYRTVSSSVGREARLKRGRAAP